MLSVADDAGFGEVGWGWTGRGGGGACIGTRAHVEEERDWLRRALPLLFIGATHLQN